jgi:hypothetical protein
MQATRAYIASAGTAVVMLGASLCMFVVVSAFVAFGSWPGDQSHANVDQVLLGDDVAQPRSKTVAVRADAVVVARRAEQRRGARRQAVNRATPGTPTANGPAGTTAPTTSSTTAPAPSPAPGGKDQAPVQKQAADVKQQVDTTTGDVTTQVQQQTQTVQTQVTEVVDQVSGVVDQVTGAVGQVTSGAQPPPAPDPVNTVKDAAGSLLGR